MEIMRRTPWSRIQGQNSVYKYFLEIVGNGGPTGSVLKETIAVSATISISVEKLDHQIRLRRVPVVECIDGLARITSKELATTHFVKGGTLQNVSSTRPKLVVGLGKSAHSHIVRLMNSRQKGPKRMMTNAAAMLKKGNWQERGLVTDQCLVFLS